MAPYQPLVDAGMIRRFYLDEMPELANAPLGLSILYLIRQAASAASVERILARGEPVYGINTGFGKLAGVRIKPSDLAELQRNIVLSHAAGVGDESCREGITITL